jgi:hypothetical protein
MFSDEKRRDADVEESKADEIEDLDAPEHAAEKVQGGVAAKLTADHKTTQGVG